MEWRGCHLITSLLLVCVSVLHNCQPCIMLVPNLISLLHSERVPKERGRTEHVLSCYTSYGFPSIRGHPAYLSLFLQMKFLSHHQGEAKAAWTRYATSGEKKEIHKLNSLFIGIIESHQLLIPIPDRMKLHGLAESKIMILQIILDHRIKWLKDTLKTILSCLFILSVKKLDSGKISDLSKVTHPINVSPRARIQVT